MDADTVSAFISALAFLLSLYSLYRSGKAEKSAAEVQSRSLALQDAGWRQQFGQELQELSFLLTQSQLSTQRDQQRNDAAERQMEILSSRAPGHPTIVAMRKELAETRAVDEKQEKTYADMRNAIKAIWASPSSDQIASVQQMKTSLRETLARLEALEPEHEKRLQSLIASVAKLA